MDDADIAALSKDIKVNGQRAPITLLDGKILDGRNRWRACKLAGVEPETREFPTTQDALQFVLSANLHRRHLSESQRSLVAAKIANLSNGEQKRCSANLQSMTKITQTEAAKTLNVSTRLVSEAKQVLASPTKAKAVERGEKTVHAAAKEIKAEKEAKEIHLDETGYEIPDKILPLWNRRGEVKEIQSAIATALRMVKVAHEKPDPLWQPVNLQGTASALNNAKRDLDLAFPFAVCCTCQGRVPKECVACKGRGFISKHHFDVCVPEDLKKVRAKSCVQ